METAGEYQSTDTAAVESSLELQEVTYTDIDGDNPKLRIPIAPPIRKGCKFSKRTKIQRLQDSILKQPGPRRDLGSPVEKTEGKKARNGGGGGAQPSKAGLKRNLSSGASNEGKKKRSAADMAGSAHPKTNSGGGAQAGKAGLKRKLSSGASNGGKKKRSAADMGGSSHRKKAKTNEGKTNEGNKKAKT